jgi:hypothetical protein
VEEVLLVESMGHPIEWIYHFITQPREIDSSGFCPNIFEASDHSILFKSLDDFMKGLIA